MDGGSLLLAQSLNESIEVLSVFCIIIELRFESRIYVLLRGYCKVGYMSLRSNHGLEKGSRLLLAEFILRISYREAVCVRTETKVSSPSSPLPLGRAEVGRRTPRDDMGGACFCQWTLLSLILLWLIGSDRC